MRSIQGLLVILAVVFCACGRAGGGATDLGAGEPGRYAPPGGRFSYVPPSGWDLKEVPGMKYQFAMAAPEDGFAPNLNVVDEACPVGELDPYVGLSLQTMEQMFSGFAAGEQTDFPTASGLGGKRVAYGFEQNGIKLANVAYFFRTPRRCYVVTCSDLAAHERRHAGECDAAVKTFRAG